jgi:hypothetical protein
MEKCLWAVQRILLPTGGKSTACYVPTTEAYKMDRMKSSKMQLTAKFDHLKICKEVYKTRNETIKIMPH